MTNQQGLVRRRGFWCAIGLVLSSCAPGLGGSAISGEGLEWTLPTTYEPAVQQRCDRVYRATQRLAHHLLGLVHPWAEDPSLLLLAESQSNEHHIRPNTGAVAGLAFLYRFGPYDAGIVGISRQELLARRILPMMRYLSATHITGEKPTSDGKKWGDHWQSAHWAESLALAAWWAGGDLPADLADAVRRVVAHEAGRFVDAAPPHRLRDDTKAEENAWNSQILSAAILLMPNDPRRPKWEKAFQRWALSAWLRPADAHSPVVVDERPVSEQFRGANIHDDFTLENHRIVHPDYMTTWTLSLGCAIHFAMTGRKPPEALVHNVPGIYENLKWFTLPDAGFVYASGQDWSVFRQVDWLHMHALMAAFGRDPEAWSLLDRGLEGLERMHARSPDGAVYVPEEHFFASAQTDTLVQFARIWLCLHFAADSRPVAPQRWGVRRLDSARMILHRSRSAVHALSWDGRVMAQCMPLQKDRLISPHERSGVGHIRLAGQDKPLDVAMVDIVVQNDGQSFAADLVVTHGRAVRAELGYRSDSDGAWTIAEKLVATGDVTTTEIATGLIGILNDKRWIYQRGERNIDFGDQRRVVPSGSGETFGSDGVLRLGVDAAFFIESRSPLRVRYQAGSKPRRSRITDELYLNYIGGGREWQAGETIAEWEATIRCRPADR